MIVFHLDKSGKDDNDLHSPNIQLILVTWLVFHLDISGKEYNDKGELVFEGEYLNGEKWNGKEKEYDYDDRLIYEIKYINGKKKLW